MSDAIAFTSFGARSKSLVWGVSMAMAVESVALHLLLLRRWPWISILLALMNAYAIWWLARDYRSVAELPTLVRPNDLLVRLGKRAHGAVPYGMIASAERPSWQTIPTGTTKGYMKLSGSDDPNVLLRFRQPLSFTMLFGVRKMVQIVGLRLDDADGFLKAVTDRLNGAAT